MKRIQEKPFGEDPARSGYSDSQGAEKKDDEEAEASRALTVVNKKLSKTLSVSATVNELIQTAEDERNLACLFAGMWFCNHLARISILTVRIGWAAFA